MLQKPNTKFGYAHRILALPVVFTLAFAYMVNAKNKEIEKSNQEIEKAVAKIKQDTTKAKATVTAVLVKGEASFSMDEKLKNSTEKSLFIIDGEEVSRSEFMKQYEINKGKRNIVAGYSSAEGNEHLYKEFGVLGPYGEFEKYGVFQMDNVEEMKNNIKKYHKIQDKYAPEWREYLKSLKKPENQARLDRIMAEKDAEILEKTEKQVEEDISPLKKQIGTATRSENQTLPIYKILKNSGSNTIDNLINVATDKDIFLINGKIVNKNNFIAEATKVPSLNSIGHTLMFSGDKKIFHLNTDGNTKRDSKIIMDMQIGNSQLKSRVQEILNNESKNEIQVSTNPYAEFFQKQNAKRIARSNEVRKVQNDLQKLIAQKNEASKLKNSLYKGRDYDKNPLTHDEIAQLKKEAKEIEELNKIVYTKRTKEDENNYALFQVEKMERRIVDINGNAIGNTTSDTKSNNFLFRLDDADFYIDGKKVSKEEFMKYQATFENVKSNKQNSKIKLLKEERVGDGRFSYAMRYEIFTK